MSLKQKIVIFILNLMLVLLLGTYLLSLANTKNFLEEELVNHAQDTATSLGLSLSTVADPSDEATIETMINAVFDRGYYSRIALIDQEGKVRYERTTSNKIEGVPAWFIRLIPITSPPTESVVQSGWSLIGTLVVQSHPGYAYVKLWHESLSLLLWFILMAMVAIAVVFYALKVLLQPLFEVEKQAKAIVRKEYIVQQELPDTTELKRVVIAMNSMVEKMRELFERDAQQIERLQKQAYLDSVTRYSNRTHFEMRFEAWVDPEESTSHGIACLLRLQDLKALNTHEGYLAGDQYLMGIAKAWQESFEKEGVLEGFYARLNGSELITLLSQATQEQVMRALERFYEQAMALRASLKISAEHGAFALGAAPYEQGVKRPALMMRLDQAVQQAQKNPQKPIYFLEGERSEQLLEQWQARLTRGLEQGEFKLYQQSAYDSSGHVHDTELLIRWQDEGVLRSAGYFMPMVQRLGLTAQLEQYVLKQLLELLKAQPPETFYAINLSAVSVKQPDTLEAFLKALEAEGSGRITQVAFEIDEALVHESPKEVATFISRIRQRLPVKIGIDHVGSGFRDQYYFIELMPDYLKLDGGFAKNILLDESTQTYVSAIAELASRLDIESIAMSVETEDQATAFQGYGVHYCQGYLYGAPEPLEA